MKKTFNPHIVLTAGGTGGHVFPAQAVAESLKGSCKLTLVTDARGLKFVSGELLRAKLIQIRAQNFSGSFLRHLCSVAMLLFSFIKVFFQFVAERPSLIIGFGGYASVPAVVAGYLLNIPIILHEQNAVMGKANMLLAKIANAVALSFAATQNTNHIERYKLYFTGNPIRDKIHSLVDKPCKKIDKYIFKILVIGGSQGASIFSEVVPKSIAMLTQDLALNKKIYVYQQVPQISIHAVQRIYENTKSKFEIKDFFDNIESLLYKSDLVIARSGASTITELIATRKPSILVPLASSQNNHQFFNAKFLQDHGASILVEEPDFTSENLKELLKNIITDHTTMSELQQGVRMIKIVNATHNLTTLALQIADTNKK